MLIGLVPVLLSVIQQVATLITDVGSRAISIASNLLLLASNNSNAITSASQTGQSIANNSNPCNPKLQSCGSNKGIKQNLEELVNKIKENKGNPPEGYKGGKQFMNDGRDGTRILPKFDKANNPIIYREYDVNPYQANVNRGGERLIFGSDGSVWYTTDHYFDTILFK